jgi:SAM-dependent methyltransferase/acyl carrier protein
LVAYVVPRAPGTPNAQSSESEWLSGIVSQFESGYGAAIQEANRQSSPSSPLQDPTLNIYGWSGLEKTDEEVAEWIEQVASRILPFQPKRLLEIGCGTGLVLFRLAPEVEEYWATDLSQVAVDNIQQRLRQTKDLGSNVKVLRQMADSFQGLPEQGFDGVILNAVLEYFPNVDYLLRVLRGAVNALKPGGFIFLGAVPNLAVQEVFHAWEQLTRAADTENTATVQRRARNRRLEDQRLLVSPEFFHALVKEIPAIRQVRMAALQGRFTNEASNLIADTYYDAMLQVGGSEPATPDVEWLDWRRDRLHLQEVWRRLETSRARGIGISNVPHERMQKRLRAQELLKGPPTTVRELRETLAGFIPEAGLEEMLSICEQAHFTAEVAWSDSGADGRCDVFLTRGEKGKPGLPMAPIEIDKPLLSCASNPLQVKFARDLVPELRALIQDKLPGYMLPSAFVLLDKLPLTSNGKIDRRALPAPDPVQAGAEDSYVAPRTAAEATVAGIWCDVLHLKRAGVNDNFFELGGHSLLVTQVAARIRDRFQVDLPVRRLFEKPTIAATAAAVEDLLVEEIRQLSEDDARRLARSPA